MEAVPVSSIVGPHGAPQAITVQPGAFPARGCYGLLAGVPCCGSECTIESPPGYVIGTVEQRATFCASSFVVKDNKDEVILRIDGPCCCLLCGCQDKEFPVTLPSDEHIGFITKKWGGTGRILNFSLFSSHKFGRESESGTSWGNVPNCKWINDVLLFVSFLPNFI
ncbi:Scramblase [Necator americanus]|uniref:Phospholipid scramblase n=1 Tax=Necator americanus TaxID=51031 RepID=W2TAH0_NECAM|nr:Scramblase [Necator americanus]ETN78191.1 Scramblase [Necator americanus]